MVYLVLVGRRGCLCCDANGTFPTCPYLLEILPIGCSAFSSVIGQVIFMERCGLSVHQAAALVLARRSQGCSERISSQRVAPADNGGRGAFAAL